MVYKFCGLAIKLQELLERGDQPENQLETAFTEHDISYRGNQDL